LLRKFWKTVDEVVDMVDVAVDEDDVVEIDEDDVVHDEVVGDVVVRVKDFLVTGDAEVDPVGVVIVALCVNHSKILGGTRKSYCLCHPR
jgi:hypothetical protein